MDLLVWILTGSFVCLWVTYIQTDSKMSMVRRSWCLTLEKHVFKIINCISLVEKVPDDVCASGQKLRTFGLMLHSSLEIFINGLIRGCTEAAFLKQE